MYVHDEKRLVYLAQPRTASNATGAALQTVGFRKADDDHHCRLFDGGPVTRAIRSEWFVFTTVRNHWDTIASWYWRNVRKFNLDPAEGLNALDITKDVLDRAPLIAPRNRLWWLHTREADAILRYETLERDLARVLRAFDLAVPLLPQVNVTRNRPSREYRGMFNPKGRIYVAERFREEIAEFGYHF